MWLLRELGAKGYVEALAEHRRLIRGVCAGHGSVEERPSAKPLRGNDLGVRPELSPEHGGDLLSPEGLHWSPPRGQLAAQAPRNPPLPRSSARARRADPRRTS
jgi:hypothetical protein